MWETENVGLQGTFDLGVFPRNSVIYETEPHQIFVHGMGSR